MPEDDILDCADLCAHVGEQCSSEPSSLIECMADCEEDLGERYPICKREVLAYAECCRAAQNSSLCPDGQDVDIKRCEAACPEEAESARTCGNVIVTCAQVCQRIDVLCEDDRLTPCRSECETDQANARDAFDDAPYQTFLKCCMQTAPDLLLAHCEEDGFDPCSAACENERPVSAEGEP